MTGVGNANSGDFSLPPMRAGHVLGRASNYLPAAPIPWFFNRINDAPAGSNGSSEGAQISQQPEERCAA
jgi:hypothetical protein